MLIFLRNSRGIYDPTWLPPTEDPDKQISLTELVSAAFQVARAMEFLVSRKVGDPLKEFPPFSFPYRMIYESWFINQIRV